MRDGLIGTLSYSDPETGSHFWYPIASGARRVDGGFEVLKKASWTTSAGFADFYVLQTTSPDYNGDYSNLSVFVVDKAEIEAKPEEWDAMGLRGNQSGTLLLDWKFVPEDQLVGRDRRRRLLQRRVGRPQLPDRVVRHLERHLARRDRHRHPPHDPQDPQGRRPARVRLPDDPGRGRRGDHGHQRLAHVACLGVAHALDLVTDGSQTKITDGELARGNYLPWLWQIKFNAAKNVAHVVDKMLHCCGGTGLQEGAAAARALPARRQGRLGDGADQRGAAPVRRQDRAAGDGVARLLERQVINQRAL